MLTNAKYKNSMTGRLMKTILISGIVFMILTPFFSAKAQKIIPDTTAISIGQQLNIVLEIEIAKDKRAEWPLLTDTLSKSIEIISKSTIDSIIDAQTGSINYRQQLVITSFDTGFQVIPPIQFKIYDAGTQNFNIRETEAVLITVTSVPVNMQAEIKDLKPVMEAPYTLMDFLPWILLGLGIALLALLGWFYYQSRKKKKPLIKLTLRQPKPAHVLALEQLEALKLEQLWQKGQIKDYYSRLTDILREYFDARFGVNAAEMTSEEIISAMKNHMSDAQRLKDLQKILGLSDMAKFAKARPIGAENEISHTLAVAIINSNKPAPELKPAKTEQDAESATAATKTEN